MANRTNKKRLCVWLPQNTYDNVHEFVKNNEILNQRLMPGTLIEMSVNLFFNEVNKRPLEDIAGEYLTTGTGAVEK